MINIASKILPSFPVFLSVLPRATEMLMAIVAKAPLHNKAIKLNNFVKFTDTVYCKFPF